MPGAHASCILGTLCFFEQGTAHLSRASRSPQTVSSVRNTSLLASHLSMDCLLHSLARVISLTNAVSRHCCIYILSSRIEIDFPLLPLFSFTEHRSIDQYQNAVERFVVSAQLTRSKVHPPQSNSWLGELHLGVRSLTRMRALLI